VPARLEFLRVKALIHHQMVANSVAQFAFRRVGRLRYLEAVRFGGIGYEFADASRVVKRTNPRILDVLISTFPNECSVQDE
jgi:hypothetical protein